MQLGEWSAGWQLDSKSTHSFLAHFLHSTNDGFQTRKDNHTITVKKWTTY